MIYRFIFLILISSGLWPGLSPQKQQLVRIIRILDGDTVEILKNGQHFRVRLAIIDAPEKDQKMAMTPILKVDRDYELLIMGVDRYGRIIGDFKVEQRWMSLEMIQKGQAVFYPFAKFSHRHTKSRYLIARYQAQLKRLGLYKNSSFLWPYWFRQDNKRHHKR